MRTGTHAFRFLAATFAVAFLAGTLSASSAQAQQVFDDFEAGTAGDSNQWYPYGSGVSDALSTDTPDRHGGQYSLAISADGTAGSGGISGLPSEVDVSGVANPYLNLYVKPDDAFDFQLQVELEDTDGDVFQFRLYPVQAGNDWELVSLPLDVFVRQDGRSSGDGEVGTVNKVVFQPEQYSGEQITFNTDYIAFSAGPLDPMPSAISAFDDLEGESLNWSGYGNLTASKSSATPPENGGSASLQLTADPSVSSSGGATNSSASASIAPDDAYLNFYVKPDPNTPFDLQVEFNDEDGDVFQFRTYEVDAGSDWELVSLPLGTFNLQAGRSSGDGEIGTMATSLLLQPEGYGSNAITMNADYFAFTGATALPVELTNFVAAADGRDAVLRWTTAGEVNNEGFRVLHAAPGAAFEQVHFVKGHGTTNEPQDYDYRVRDLAPGTHRFQLQQIDTDAKGPRSSIVEATIGTNEGALLAPLGPNPFRTATKLRLSSSQAGPVSVVLYDALGRRVRTLHEGTLAAGASRTVRIDADGLASGLYFVRLRTADGATDTRSLTVVK